MKEFEVEVIQKLEGVYKGKMLIKANNKIALLKKLEDLSEEEIENEVFEWDTEDFIGVGKYTFENIQEI